MNMRSRKKYQMGAFLFVILSIFFGVITAFIVDVSRSQTGQSLVSLPNNSRVIAESKSKTKDYNGNPVTYYNYQVKDANGKMTSYSITERHEK